MRRWIACLLVAALALPTLTLAVPRGGQVFQLRPPMTLVAGADSISAPIFCLGARAVFFYTRSATADNDSLSNVVIDISNDGLAWRQATETGIMTGAIVPSTFAGGQLGKAGRFHILCAASPTQINPPWIPWALARLRFSAVAQIDSFSIDAFFWDDDGSSNDRRRTNIPPR